MGALWTWDDVGICRRGYGCMPSQRALKVHRGSEAKEHRGGTGGKSELVRPRMALLLIVPSNLPNPAVVVGAPNTARTTTNASSSWSVGNGFLLLCVVQGSMWLFCMRSGKRPGLQSDEPRQHYAKACMRPIYSSSCHVWLDLTAETHKPRYASTWNHQLNSRP